MKAFHLAQANITVGRRPFDHPRMRGFASRIDRINELAHRAPGFVWRPSSDQAMADLHALGRDPWREAFNMSVWESVEALWRFTFSGEHLEAVKLSARWFDPATALDVLWWVPVGTQPTIAEGLAKLDLVREHGPTPEGFTFRRRFPVPDQDSERRLGNSRSAGRLAAPPLRPRTAGTCTWGGTTMPPSDDEFIRRRSEPHH